MNLSSPSLAVTGATGAIGGAVARHLAQLGVPQRLLVRSVDKAPYLEKAEVFPFSYSDRSASEQALYGAKTLFMISASESGERIHQHRTFIDAAKTAGIKHIIYTSFISAAPDATFTLARDHYLTEQYIQESGFDYTFLRDSFYMDFMDALVGEDGIIRGPAGDGRVAIVARADVARAASVILRDPSAHRNITYDLTGPEALTLTEIAQILATAHGRAVKFQNETVAEAYESRKAWAAPNWQNDAWVSTYTAIASGEMARISQDIETITGQRPMTLAQFQSMSPESAPKDRINNN
ncbi:SDR family oxidoreductase [Arthrobacter sp. TS-15]|uniref:SDR family oxidoreductase n=1 Tax=Arthrobacter sp. TS-15 TaxID=2510797 RepID=UPI00115C874D|nr:SDR family oxidoreductase [Arthrobacter sp. TS-15]TQS87390.1 SDR family oxidoreductase [Arthrobacter sp. TS-15]